MRAGKRWQWDKKAAIARGLDPHEFHETIRRRMKIIARGFRMGGDVKELQAIAAASDVAVTKCPPRTHADWPRLTPEQLRLRGS